MKFSIHIKNSKIRKILKRIRKIEFLMNSYDSEVEWRLKERINEKPKDLLINLKKISIYLPYTFENYEIIHNAIIKKFSKSDFSRYLKSLSDSSKDLDGRGWNNLGYIVSKECKNPFMKINALILNKIPEHTNFITGYIYRLLPSTYVLCFDFHIENLLLKELYNDFYSKNDVFLKIGKNINNISFNSISSREKYAQRIDTKTNELKQWIINELGLKEDNFISSGRILTNQITNLSSSKSNSEIIDYNSNYFTTQSIRSHSPTTYSNEESFFSIEKINDFRFYSFDLSEDFDFNNRSLLLQSLLILGVIKMYKTQTEDLRRKNINVNRKMRIMELKNETILSNSLSFQIYRFFQEIKNHYIKHEIKLISRLNFESKFMRKNHDLKEYSNYASNYVKYHEKILIENTQSINNLLEKELHALTIETNYSLQEKMKHLTIVAMVIAILSIIITTLTTDFKNIENNYNKLNKKLKISEIFSTHK